MQVKLLRVLQEREVRRVGENLSRPVDVRIIAASNRDLALGIQAGAFRQDLYYRLRVVELQVPSLRERREDILPLARELLDSATTKMNRTALNLSPKAADQLLHYPWPGNVRELENVIATAAITATGDFIDLADLPEHLQRRRTDTSDSDSWRPLSLDEVRKMHIQRVLELCKGNRLRAAQILGIGRTSLYRYLKRDGTEVHSREHGGAAA
jgi:transcriptional regulator with PAS, ATPase and Fis domain